MNIIPILKKETFSGSIHDFANIPNSELLGRLFDKGISEGGQFDHSNETGKLLEVDTFPIAHLMQHIYDHKREGFFCS